MKIVYVTRKFPPSVGGMQRAAYELAAALSRKHQVSVISYGGSNKYLPLVFPVLLCRALWQAATRKPDVVYIQDGVIAIIGALVTKLTGCKTIVTIHGLDVTHHSGLYQSLLKWALPKITAVTAVSEGTKLEVTKRFPNIIPTVIHNGLKDEFFIDKPKAELRSQLADDIGLHAEELRDRDLLITSGRLVPRKGVEWFVDTVLPGLVAQNPKILYLIAGTGKERDKIAAAIARHKLQPQVMLLGRISDQTLKVLYSSADVFVMPNRFIADDVEGFGLVAVEASSCGTPIIAADLPGIRDAVLAGKTGMLVTSEDATAFARAISDQLTTKGLDRITVRSQTLDAYSWDKAADAYATLAG